MRTIYLLLFVFGCPLFMRAQHFHAGNSALLSDHIRCAAVGSDGRIWFGTDYGLAMYDGVTVSLFTELNSTIPDHHIRSITPDDFGFMWIGTQNHGVFLFDGAVIPTHYHTANSGVTDNTVNAVVKDTLNRLWIGTTGGMNRLDGSNWTFWRDDNSSVWSNHVTSMVLDSVNNHVYAGHINGGIVAYRDTVTVYISYLMSNFPDNSITHITYDPGGWLWCSSPSSGLIQFFPQTDNWVAYKTANTNIPENTILGSAMQNGSVYFGTQNSGLVQKTGTIFNTYNTFYGLTLGKVNDVVFDLTGKMWLTTEYHGIIGLPIQELGVFYFDDAPLSSQGRIVSQGQTIQLPENTTSAKVFDWLGKVVSEGSGNHFKVPEVPNGQYVLWLNENQVIRLFIHQ